MLSRLRSPLIGFLFLLVSSCASQAPPLPPRVQVPETVRDLRSEQVGEKVALQWTLPEFATDGERLTRPMEIEIFRHLTPAGETPPETLPFAAPWVIVLPADVRGLLENKVIRFEDSFEAEELAERAGGTYLYAVRCVARSFGGRRRESKPSNVIRQRIFPVSGPVRDLAVETEESLLRIGWNWESPSDAVNRYLLGFRVYRSEGEDAKTFRLLGEVSEPHYEFLDFTYDRTYHFKVRAVFGERDMGGARSARSESEDSEIVTVTPHDAFAPQVPVGLDGLFSGEAMELIWQANAAADLAGYHVYRVLEDGSRQRLTPDPLPTPLYRDTGAEEGKSYSYAVTAVDLEGNESRPSDTVTLEAR